MITNATPGNLAAVMNFVRDAAGEPRNTRLDLLVEEAFLNIALHACPGEPVHIECNTSAPGHVTLEFRYPGPEFDPTAAPPPPDLHAPLAERSIGGLGLFLIRELASSARYQRDGSSNKLVLRFTANPARPSL